jgi:RNA polymerase sigma-70 factor (ECF subfamily)
VVYCIIPNDLAGELHEKLRFFYRTDPRVDVVVDVRYAQRRSGTERRQALRRQGAADQRARIRRSVVERRLARLARPPRAVAAPPISREHAARLTFSEVADVGAKEREDRDTRYLVARAQKGDGAAFELLYLRYFDRVYGYLSTLLNDQHEAEDTTQEVFVRVYNGLPRYRQTSAPFRAWLFTIARNTALKRLQRLGAVAEDAHEILIRRQDDPDSSAPIAPEDLLDRHVLRVTEGLPLEQRRVLFLRYTADMTQEDVSRILGKSPEAVRKLEARAKSRLEERLAPRRGSAVARGQLPMLIRERPQTVTARRRLVLWNDFDPRRGA